MPKYRVKVAESRTIAVLVEADTLDDAWEMAESPGWDYSSHPLVGDDCEDWHVLKVEEVK